jgi:hypothetical protein
MNAPHSATCQNTLGFDDGLNRLRSNMRRVDSNERFNIDNALGPNELQALEQ